jgi:hypothetical protein
VGLRSEFVLVGCDGFNCERVGLGGFILYCGSKWLIPMGVDEFA